MYDNDPSTVGVEFESVISSRDNVTKRFRLEDKRHPRIRSVTKDASVESLMVEVGGNAQMFLGNVQVRNLMRGREPKTVGYEIVTHPLSMDEARKAITEVIAMQVGDGEIFSERSSIHVHVGFPHGFIFLKTGMLLGMRVEPLLFKLAGMGNKFRGSSNNAAYCRPLALPPAVVLNDSKKFAVLDPAASVLQPDAIKFWGKLGINYGDTERYNPLRYFAVNLFSSRLRGTIEYRVFNYCNVGRYVEAVTSLCQGITELVVKLPLSTIQSIPQISIFERNSDSDYIDLLNTLLDLMRRYDCELIPTVEDVESLVELICITDQPIFERKHILSHINSGRISLSEANEYGLEIVTKADLPGIVDIHNFNSETRRLCVS